MRSRVAAVLIMVPALATYVAAEDWKFDSVYLKNGHAFEGLIVEETKDAVHFKSVSRRPGSRTSVFSTVFQRDDIARLERLSDPDRQELARRIEQLEGREDRDKARMASLVVESAPFPGNGAGLKYAGKHYVLLSNAREVLVRRVCVRLDDIFQAYTDNLGAPRSPPEPTKIVLYRSVAEYQGFLRGARANILNPAFYDPAANQIVAASDLERAAEELTGRRQKHEALLTELDQYEKRLKRHFNNQPPANLMQKIQQDRRGLQMVNSENESAFERASRPLFATLYHEAFHAYLDNFVYPSREMTVPRWLNEGLAQIYETALVETGELRVGHVDSDRLAAVQEAVRKNKLLPLSELLVSQPKHFQIAHQSEALISDRYFQASWAVAYFLRFDRKLLTNEALDKYVAELHRGANPIEAFRDFVGQPLSEFEEQFRKYIVRLRADGSLRAP
jgi:hypothetical protein